MIDKNSLLELRNKINIIDEKIIKLFSQRKQIAIQIAREKNFISQPIRDIEREKNLLENVSQLAEKYTLNKDFLKKIFKLIIEDSVSIQKKILTINTVIKKNNIPIFNFLGPKGSYSHIAMLEYSKKYFKQVNANQYTNFKEIIHNTEEKKLNYAILPIENTSSGNISEVYDLLHDTKLSIIDEIYLPINHCLLALPGASLRDIETIYSHSQPLKQCSQFINHFPWNKKCTSSSSEAIKKIYKIKKYNVAALGSETGGKIYNLNILLRNISNQQYNITRFIILHSILVKPKKLLSCKTSLSFIIKKKSNTLIDIIEILQKNKLIIKKLYHRPLHKKFEKKIVYIDILTHLNTLPMKDALLQLRKTNQSFKILGCYKTNHV